MANFLPAVYIPCESGRGAVPADPADLMFLAYAHDLGMTKPDGTVLLAVMNGKYRRLLSSHIHVLTLARRYCSLLDPRLTLARIPLGQDLTPARHLALLLWHGPLLHLSVGIRD